ncbi:MAG: universal stress protein, partial [Chitinophagales bacterium]
MKKILIPVDFSDYTWSTIEFALQMSENTAAEIRLIHAFDDPFVDRDIAATPFQNQVSAQTEALIHKMEKDAMEAMEALIVKVKAAVRHRAENQLKLSSKVVRGFVSDEILREAKLWHPHLLLMGSRGHTRVEKFVFGTITQSIVKNATVPVLALPANYNFRPMRQI